MDDQIGMAIVVRKNRSNALAYVPVLVRPGGSGAEAVGNRRKCSPAVKAEQMNLPSGE
jgi:hypothetical protein